MPLRSAVIGVIESEYFYDGNYFSRYTRNDAKCFPENIGKRGSRLAKENGSEVQLIKSKDPLVDNFSTRKIQTRGQFQVPSNWIRTKSCRTTFPNRFVPETLGERGFDRTFETRNERGGRATVLEERSTKVWGRIHEACFSLRKSYVTGTGRRKRTKVPTPGRTMHQLIVVMPPYVCRVDFDSRPLSIPFNPWDMIMLPPRTRKTCFTCYLCGRNDLTRLTQLHSPALRDRIEYHTSRFESLASQDTAMFKYSVPNGAFTSNERMLFYPVEI